MCQVISPPAVAVKPPHQYHQTHRPAGLLACPACRHETMLVRSYGSANEPRVYYAMCDNERCPSAFVGLESQPTHDQVTGLREAVKGCNESLIAYAREVLAGNSGAVA